MPLSQEPKDEGSRANQFSTAEVSTSQSRDPACELIEKDLGEGIMTQSAQRSEDVEIEQPKQEGPFVIASFRCNGTIETSNERGKIEAKPPIDDDAAKLFVQDAVRATNEWAYYVLVDWLDSEDRQPGEFLGIEGWTEGPNLVLKAVPSHAPESRLEFEPSFQIQTAPVRNRDHPCGVA